MVTEFGKFLRKLRIDNDELMLDMADKLEVSAAFLSSVENGKKKPPKDWESKIARFYSLEDSQKMEWERVFFIALNSKELDMEQFSGGTKDFMLEFARKVDGLSENDTQKIKKMLDSIR